LVLYFVLYLLAFGLDAFRAFAWCFTWLYFVLCLPLLYGVLDVPLVLSKVKQSSLNWSMRYLN
jgi:hypothetical protein